jgi:hypothetical protein
MTGQKRNDVVRCWWKLDAERRLWRVCIVCGGNTLRTPWRRFPQVTEPPHVFSKFWGTEFGANMLILTVSELFSIRKEIDGNHPCRSSTPHYKQNLVNRPKHGNVVIKIIVLFKAVSWQRYYGKLPLTLPCIWLEMLPSCDSMADKRIIDAKGLQWLSTWYRGFERGRWLLKVVTREILGCRLRELEIMLIIEEIRTGSLKLDRILCRCFGNKGMYRKI